jgi:hypothetical protein
MNTYSIWVNSSILGHTWVRTPSQEAETPQQAVEQVSGSFRKFVRIVAVEGETRVDAYNVNKVKLAECRGGA